MKYVKIKFSNGDRFKIPANKIAVPRAVHYANNDEGEQSGECTDAWTKVYDEEIELALKDDYTLTDWLWNNMDWKDVKADAIKMQDGETKYNYDKHFMDITEDDDNYEVIEE